MRPVDQSLFLAIKNNSAAAVLTALSQKADPNSVSPRYEARPLDFAIKTGASPEILRRLMDGGASITHVVDGKPYLSWVVSQENETAVGCLLRTRVDIHCADDEGKTPLHEAVQVRNLKIAKMLVQFGADPDRPDKNGESARMMAKREGKRDVLSLMPATTQAVVQESSGPSF